MKARHMTKREWREYRRSFKNYADDLERTHSGYFKHSRR